MSCSKNSDKVKKVAVRTGITALASGFAITSVLMAKRIFTRRKDKNSAKVDAAELDRQVEELKYLEAQSIGRFYDPLQDKDFAAKYVVAGRYTLDGRLTKDSIEMFDQAQAMSLALSAGYTPWKVEARIDDNDGDEDDRKITYKITNLITQETYDSTEEPHGRRCRDRDGTWFEDERAEADRPHDVIDKFSNQVVV